MAKHRWQDQGAMGHGSGDGTPAGITTSRRCVICGVTAYHDTAVSTHTGRTRAARWWRDAYGYRTDTCPDCLGYDPLAD